MQFRARRYDTGEVLAVTVVQQQIAGLQVPVTSEIGLSRTVASADEPWVAPGFVDLQINGFGGIEFNDAQLSTEQVEQVSRACDAMGVTGYCPTVTTHGFDSMARSLAAIARACRESPAVARRVVAIHLEGPYLSPEDGPRGAHPLVHCRPPDWDEFCRFQDAAEGRIKLLTMSPEFPGSSAFIQRVVATGVVVAIGHTKADAQQIHDAAQAGATLSTHLGNGAHAMIRRHPNYIWDQLAEDRLAATLIADGHHLPASVVKSFVRAKSPQRCILVSDLVGLAGKPPGVYSTRAGDIEVLEDGRLVVAGQRQYLFGAGRSLPYGIANVMRYADVDLKTAVDMASKRPMQALNLEPGRLQVGAAADLVCFDLPTDGNGPLTIRATLQSGELVYGSLG